MTGASSRRSAGTLRARRTGHRDRDVELAARARATRPSGAQVTPLDGTPVDQSRTSESTDRIAAVEHLRRRQTGGLRKCDGVRRNLRSVSVQDGKRVELRGLTVGEAQDSLARSLEESSRHVRHCPDRTSGPAGRRRSTRGAARERARRHARAARPGYGPSVGPADEPSHPRPRRAPGRVRPTARNRGICSTSHRGADDSPGGLVRLVRGESDE